MSKQVFDEIKDLITETRNPRTMDIDAKDTLEILHLINQEDRLIPDIVAQEIPYIAQAVEIVVAAFKNGGRLFYIGAGTSGRLGILDASECPPTYGTDPEMIQGIIAGGYKALVRSQEGAEDIRENGGADLREAGFNRKDVAFGIAASRRTPYVLGALEYAREIGAKTVYLTCNPRAEITIPVDVAICPVVGPEVIMGSTRMKAGTATKLVLNMLTTTAMIRLGKVYGNMMVDLRMTSKKLEERSKRVVMMVTGVSYEKAAAVLDKAGGHVKTALVMLLANVPAQEAHARLERANGFIRAAIAQPVAAD
ncbi:MAG: N-acetylmuramic acid 6-phosphate etherase [candidate division KSB1 bacterium]|nr:N-acetylmuramic acid 6-phosphate etherase [candidate division KSB1 bacterium]MDZ7274349.1 N-acetylmuramic acid 6-phosphate etherase [candidate division KSB1 bacterium]MDZ7284989.1 N-acetylmuramic acid 6-phosphate etherase [candidate division KSB1 bacterium]MDZ7297590.1 N-acetylmuramic acid 6-phosphate etherase [candidate division KSB1 bacterium]MDZ7308662.1 N-acetylmuramic acid 6-phosphate etherase [candidate division KSB1 bacterium]